METTTVLMETTTVQAVQLGVAVITLVVSTTVGVIAYLGTRRIAKVQYWRGVRDAWMDISKFALSDEKMLKMADSLFHPDLAGQREEDVRKRWFGYMVLNAGVSHFFGEEAVEHENKKCRQERLDRLLKPLMRDDIIYSLVQTGVYNPKFEEWCRTLREPTPRS